MPPTIRQRIFAVALLALAPLVLGNAVLRAATAGEVVLANPIAREILGEDALGMGSTPRGRYTLHRLDGTPLAMTEIPLIRALQEGQASRNTELIIRYEHGSGIVALLSATPVAEAPEGTHGVVEVVVEVVSEVVSLQELMVSANLEEQGVGGEVRAGARNRYGIRRGALRSYLSKQE